VAIYQINVNYIDLSGLGYDLLDLLTKGLLYSPTSTIGSI